MTKVESPLFSIWQAKCNKHDRRLAERMTREAYGSAYQNGFRLTVRFLLSRGIRNESAMEFAQAGWARGWEMLAQLRDENMVSTWVNSIALNYYRKWLRQEGNFSTLPDLHGGEEPNMAAIDLRKVLKFVKPDDRLLFQRRMEGESISEIAKDNQVSDTAIRLRLLRARRTVRSQVIGGSASRTSRYESAA